jgi:hypothetical protein
MRPVLPIITIAASLALPQATAVAQDAAPGGSAQPIFGYLDVKTRTFTAAPTAPLAPASTKPIIRAGTITVVATFIIDPSIPKDAKLTAVVKLSVNDAIFMNGVGPLASRHGAPRCLGLSQVLGFAHQSGGEVRIVAT